MVACMKGKAQVEACHEVLTLAVEVLAAEQSKRESGVSTIYIVILRQRDLAAARAAQISAAVTYAKALVDLHRATGSTLKENGIELNDALTGEVTKRPSPPFQSVQKSSVGSK